MKAKRFWLVLLAILSVLCMSFAIAGCEEEAEVPPDPGVFTKPKHEHTFSEWEIVKDVKQCSEEEGLRKRHCTDPDCTTPGGYVEEEVIPAIGHDKEIIPRQEPTCIDGGWNEYWKCKKCSASNFEEMKIDALDHDWRTIEAQEATCYQEGWDEHEECYRCHKTQGNVNLKPMTAHDYSDVRDGFTFCKMCGQPKLDETANLTYTLASDGKSYIVTGYKRDDNNKILDEKGEVYQYQDKLNLESDEKGNLYEVNGETRTPIKYHAMMSLVIPAEHEGLPVSEVAKEAFKECRFITRIVTGNSVKIIGSEAFTQCINLREITLGPLTETVGESAFSYSKVKSINFPQKVNNIGMAPFAYCTEFDTITVHEKNKTYLAEGNCVIERSSDTIILGCAGSVIPDSAKYIGSWSFAMCLGLKQIEMKNIEYISPNAFMLDANLEKVAISEKCEYIEASAFYGCPNLSDLTISAGLKRIGASAFANCYKLKVIRFRGTEAQFRDSKFIRSSHWDYNDGLVDENGNRLDGEANWTRRTYLIELNNAQYLMADETGYKTCTQEEADAFLEQYKDKAPEQSGNTGSEETDSETTGE